MPISSVMELPMHELNMWACVFMEEHRELHPESTDEELEEEFSPARAFALIGGDVVGKNDGNS